MAAAHSTLLGIEFEPDVAEIAALVASASAPDPTAGTGSDVVPTSTVVMDGSMGASGVGSFRA